MSFLKKMLFLLVHISQHVKAKLLIDSLRLSFGTLDRERQLVSHSLNVCIFGFLMVRLGVRHRHMDWAIGQETTQ